MHMLTIELGHAVLDELAAARKKSPRNLNLNVALMEEVGEFAQAQLQGKSAEEVKTEGIQVIALVLRILEDGDASIGASHIDWSQREAVGEYFADRC
jgi:S-adenosylmethionine/arginine decarboxylase-like enzyme